MSTIASLVVKLGADTKGLTGGLRRAGASIAGLAGKVAGLGASVAGGGLAVMIKQSIDAGDRIQKLAIQTGLSTEFLSQMGHAAELSGSNLETLAKGTKRMQDAAVEAAKGTKQYSDAFDELGINADDFLKLRPDQQFTRMAEALASIKDPARRTALAMDIMGRSGTELIPLLEGGAKGIAKMRGEADKLGLTLGRKQADQMAAVNDAISNLQGAMAGAANVLAVELAPHMVNFINFLTARLPALVKVVSGLFGGIGKLIGGAGAGIGALLSGNFSGALEAVKGSFGDASKSFGESVDGLAKLFGEDASTSKAQLEEQKKQTRTLGRVAGALEKGIVATAG